MKRSRGCAANAAEDDTKCLSDSLRLQFTFMRFFFLVFFSSSVLRFFASSFLLCFSFSLLLFFSASLLSLRLLETRFRYHLLRHVVTLMACTNGTHICWVADTDLNLKATHLRDMFGGQYHDRQTNRSPIVSRRGLLCSFLKEVNWSKTLERVFAVASDVISVAVFFEKSKADVFVDLACFFSICIIESTSKQLNALNSDLTSVKNYFASSDPHQWV